MRRIWFYTQQRAAVEEWAHQLALPLSLHAVDTRNMEILHGLEDEVFVRIVNHPAVVPQPLWEMLSQRGFTIVTIDDANNRRRHRQ